MGKLPSIVIINERGLLLTVSDIFLYLFNAALKFRLVRHSLFIVSITRSYVVSKRNSSSTHL